MAWALSRGTGSPQFTAVEKKQNRANVIEGASSPNNVIMLYDGEPLSSSAPYSPQRSLPLSPQHAPIPVLQHSPHLETQWA